MTCDNLALEGWVTLFTSPPISFPKIYQPIWLKNVPFVSNATLHKGGILSRGPSGKWSCVITRWHQSENTVLHFVTSAVVLAFWSVSWLCSEDQSCSKLVYVFQSVILLYDLLYLPRLGYLFPRLADKPKNN